ncbi:MAG: hypothetical protein ABJZ55_25110 [Fuerstiella sp.]
MTDPEKGQDAMMVSGVNCRGDHWESRGRLMVLVTVFLTLSGCVDTASEFPDVDKMIANDSGHGTAPKAACMQKRDCSIAIEERHESLNLAGKTSKVWRVASAEVSGECCSPFTELTIFQNGTWEDVSGLTGLWRIDASQTKLCFEVHQIPSLLSYTVLLMSHECLELQLNEPTMPCWQCLPYSVIVFQAASNDRMGKRIKSRQCQ